MSRLGAKLVLPLVGGLGNQLFQVAAALRISSDRNLDLEILLGLQSSHTEPTTNEDILEFLNPNVRITKLTGFELLISRKITSLNLSQIARPKSLRSHTISILSDVVFSLQFRRHVFTFLGDSLGYCPFPQTNRTLLAIGYFQSYRYLINETIELFRKNLWTSTRSNFLRTWVTLAEAELPIIVHIRRGDYFNEPQFGLLSKSYYESVIRQIVDSTSHRNFWVFSDEPEIAKRIVPETPELNIRYFSPSDLSTLDTLAVMSLGRGFILANSTYSYWSAILSRTNPEFVRFPVPWFRSQATPNDLNPPSWVGMKSTWE